MITSEDNAGVPKFNSVKQYEEAFKLIVSDVNNLKQENQVLRARILQLHQAIAVMSDEPTNYYDISETEPSS